MNSKKVILIISLMILSTEIFSNPFKLKNESINYLKPTDYKLLITNKFYHKSYDNWFHIGIASSGFTYFLFPRDPLTNLVDFKKSPYIGFSFMPEVTLQIGNRVLFYTSFGWTGMQEFYNLYYDQTVNNIPPTNINRAPFAGSAGISFALLGYEGGINDKGPKDAYYFPIRFSLGVGYGNFKWDSYYGFVNGSIFLVSLQICLFLINLGY